MPLKHQSTKSHKSLVIYTMTFCEFPCFSDFVAKKYFSNWVLSEVLGSGWGIFLSKPDTNGETAFPGTLIWQPGHNGFIFCWGIGYKGFHYWIPQGGGLEDYMIVNCRMSTLNW